MKKSMPIGLAAAFVLLFSGLGFSKDGVPQKVAAPPVRKELIKLKYIDATDIMMLLQSYRSRDGLINMSRDANKNNLVVISDSPEVVEKMIALIKEVDIKPAELLFTVQLVLGTEAAEEKTDDSLKNDPVIKEIRNLLRYKNFSLLDTTLVRTMEREDSQVRFGKNGEYSLSLRPKYIKDEKEENIQTEIKLGYSMTITNAAQNYLIMTTLTMKSGEKTVVGVSKMAGSSDRGLILIISGKIVK